MWENESRENWFQEWRAVGSRLAVRPFCVRGGREMGWVLSLWKKVSILYGVTFGASRALLIVILPVLGVGVVHHEVRKPQFLQVM